MKILVTGANGFIGSTLVARLVEEGHHCDGLDIQFTQNLPLNKQFRIDISEPFQLDESYDCVFHLGAYNVTHVGKKDQHKYKTINVDGTRNVIHSCRFEKFIFFSTVKIYDAVSGVIDENSRIAPQSDYAQSKMEAEEVCVIEAGDKLTIFRSVNVAGPGQAKKALIPVLFDKALKNEAISIFVPQKTEVHLLDIDDLIELFVDALNPDRKKGVFNISSKDCMAIDEVVNFIKYFCESSSEIVFSDQNDPVNPQFISRSLHKFYPWKTKLTCREIIQKYGEYINNGI